MVSGVVVVFEEEEVEEDALLLGSSSAAECCWPRPCKAARGGVAMIEDGFVDPEEDLGTTRSERCLFSWPLLGVLLLMIAAAEDAEVLLLLSVS